MLNKSPEERFCSSHSGAETPNEAGRERSLSATCGYKEEHYREKT